MLFVGPEVLSQKIKQNLVRNSLLNFSLILNQNGVGQRTGSGVLRRHFKIKRCVALLGAVLYAKLRCSSNHKPEKKAKKYYSQIEKVV